MKEILDELKSCLYTPTYAAGNKDFETWLLQSNCSKIGPYLKEERFKNMLEYIVYGCLEEILDVLMRSPQADYFWYTYQTETNIVKQNGGELTWAEPHHDVVPSDALRVDKEKIKVFLRDIKIDNILQ
jgi:hypothetical protein